MQGYRQRAGLVMVLAAACLPAGAAAAALVPAPSPLVLSEEPELRIAVSLTAVSLPLDDVLQRISQHYRVELEADRATGFQRVTVRVDREPLHLVMTRLTALLSHSVEAPYTYHWSRVRSRRNNRGGSLQGTGSSSASRIYRLTKGERAATKELEQLNRPRVKMQALLREFRDLARLSPPDRAAYRTSLDVEMLAQANFQPYVKAFASLNDTEFNRLLRGETLRVSACLFVREAARATENWGLWQKELAAERTRRLARGELDQFPDGIPIMPRFAPTLAIRHNDPDGDNPQGGVQYLFKLSQVTEGDTGYLPLWYDHPNKYEDLPDTRVDLTAALNGPGVTDAQKGDVGYALGALAQAANLTIYQEHFYHPTGIGSRFSGFRTLRGPVREVVRAICDTWHYRVVKRGDDYFFWPYAWALDRSVDVPEPVIERWRRRFKAQGELSLDELAEMAVTFSQGQLSQTMRIAFPESGRWGAENTRLLRVWGLLSPTQRAAASSPEGLPLHAVPVRARLLLMEQLERSKVHVGTDELARSRLLWVAPEIRNRKEKGRPEPRVMALLSPERALFRRHVKNDAPRDASIRPDQLHEPH